jgi:hypothetical protein
MLTPRASSPSELPLDRAARRQALRERLQPLLERAAEAMIDELADLPDDQLFGAIELRLRDHARQLAAGAHQARLDGTKKGATPAPASPARTAPTTPASRGTSLAPS